MRPLLVVVVAREVDEILVRGRLEMAKLRGLPLEPLTELTRGIPLQGPWGAPYVSGNPSVPLCLWAVWSSRAIVADQWRDVATLTTREQMRYLLGLPGNRIRVFLRQDEESLRDLFQRARTAVNWMAGSPVPRQELV